jgi:hypothetical protein
VVFYDVQSEDTREPKWKSREPHLARLQDAQMPTQRNKIKTRTYTEADQESAVEKDPRQIDPQIRDLKFESSTDAYGFY